MGGTNQTPLLKNGDSWVNEYGFVLKLDSDFNVIWFVNHQYSGYETNYNSLSVDYVNNEYLYGGYDMGTLNSSGSETDSGFTVFN